MTLLVTLIPLTRVTLPLNSNPVNPGKMGHLKFGHSFQSSRLFEP